MDWKKELFAKEGWKTQEKGNSIGLDIEKGILWKQPMDRAQFSLYTYIENEYILIKKLKIYDIRWGEK